MEWKGPNSGVASQKAQIVADPAQWKKLWKDALNQDAPAVDFKGKFAVVVFAGAEPTGGWRVELSELSAPGAEPRVIGWKVAPPPPGAFVTQAFTQPYLIQVLDGDGSKVQLKKLD